MPKYESLNSPNYQSVKKARIREVFDMADYSQKEYDYMGHLRKVKFLQQGHNSNKIKDLFKDLDKLPGKELYKKDENEKKSEKPMRKLKKG